MTYNHAYTISFSVSGSTHPNGEDVTPERMRSAILARTVDLMAANEILEAADFPYDTYEEDQEFEFTIGADVRAYQDITIRATTLEEALKLITEDSVSFDDPTNMNILDHEIAVPCRCDYTPPSPPIWSLVSSNDGGIVCSLHRSKQLAEADQMACIQEYAEEYPFIDFDQDYETIIDALENTIGFIDSYSIEEHAT